MGTTPDEATFLTEFYPGTGLYVGERASEFVACLRTAIPGAGVDMLAPKVAIMRTDVQAAPIFIGAATCLPVRFDGTPGD